MVELTDRERITILMMVGYGNNRRSYENVRVLFNQQFRVGQTGISKNAVKTTVNRFNNNGTVKNLPKSGRPVEATNAENQLNVALSIQENPHNSIRKIQQEHGLSYGTTQRILKRHLKFHPYKVKLVHKLNEDDPDRRLQFSEIMMNRINADPQLLNRIIFSDEATFFLNGSVNRHNMSYWSDTNPHWIMDTRSTQWPQKIMVWAGIMNNRIIGPFFIEGNLTGDMYEDLLRVAIIPAIQDVVGEDFDQTWFQQDGAAPHYKRSVRDYINQVFPHRWIGRRGEIEWPARSPDLTPLDYFFWGYLKDRVYRTQPANLQELQQRIEDEIAAMTPEMIQRSVQNFYQRLAYCQEVGGDHFEQFTS